MSLNKEFKEMFITGEENVSCAHIKYHNGSLLVRPVHREWFCLWNRKSHCNLHIHIVNVNLMVAHPFENGD